MITNKVYIGQTVTSLGKRWSVHKSAKRKCPLSSSIIKHGYSKFIIEPLCSVLDIKDLDILEIYFINKYDCLYPKGYNLIHGGQTNRSGQVAWNKGIKGLQHSPKTQFKKGCVSIFKGKKHSEKALKLISENGNRIEIQCIETGEIYKSVKQAAEHFNISISYLWRLCDSGKKHLKLNKSFKLLPRQFVSSSHS